MARQRKGFTLIELLIVVVIIGILAAIAIPKFADTKAKAIVTSMKSDLKNLVPAYEAHYSSANTYAGLTPAPVASSGNVFSAKVENATGWSMSVTNPAVSGTTCQIAVGSQATALSITEGVPTC